MKIPVNKFLLEVEEMNCYECSAITGHVHTGAHWTCCACGNQIGKQISSFKKFLKKIFK